MKKILIISILSTLILFLGGCNKTARQTVENYFNNYNILENGVLDDINNVISEEDLNDKNKELYEEVLKKQYRNLDYEITNETYNGDEAIINVKISVFDYYKAIKNATDYLKENPDGFNDENGQYDNNLFVNYKLKEMNLMSEKIDYSLDIYLQNTSEGWVITDLTDTDLDKIHGTYNYES